MAAPFTPKQAPARNAANMAQLMGDVSLQVARAMVASLPSMPPSSVVHDNACGNGVVTQSIIETQTAAKVTIHATDINPTMTAATDSVASKLGGDQWAGRVHTAVMPAEKLEFPDNTFSHSYMNFLVFGVLDAHVVAGEMLRTLKPAAEGGVGYVTTWARMGHEDAILAAHKATRPEGKRHPMELRAAWKDPSYVKKVLSEAGFKEVKMSTLDTVLTLENTDKWAGLSWGFSGAPEGGWLKEDEEKYDEAVKIVKEKLVSSELYEDDGKGGARVRMVVNVAEVTK